eukprot:g82510.t1
MRSRTKAKEDAVDKPPRKYPDENKAVVPSKSKNSETDKAKTLQPENRTNKENIDWGHEKPIITPKPDPWKSKDTCCTRFRRQVRNFTLPQCFILFVLFLLLLGLAYCWEVFGRGVEHRKLNLLRTRGRNTNLVRAPAGQGNWLTAEQKAARQKARQNARKHTERKGSEQGFSRFRANKQDKMNKAKEGKTDQGKQQQEKPKYILRAQMAAEYMKNKNKRKGSTAEQKQVPAEPGN